MRAIQHIKAMKSFLGPKIDITDMPILLPSPRESAGYFYGQSRSIHLLTNVSSI